MTRSKNHKAEALGIRPTVDFVFKLLFGDPNNVDLLIHLLNSVLQPEHPIEHVTILNPYNEKQFKEDKLSIVDIKAQDSSGDWYVIEVQTTIPVGLANRLIGLLHQRSVPSPNARKECL